MRLGLRELCLIVLCVLCLVSIARTLIDYFGGFPR